MTGAGTGGTFQGVARMLREARPECKIVLSEPKVAPIISTGEWAPHPVQGWTPNFTSKVTQVGLNRGLHDQILLVDGPDAMRTTVDLCRKEGIFCGISGGATVATALEVCKKAPDGSTVLAMVPDTAERYLSLQLFEDIDADMNDDEREIAASTPSAQMD